MSIIGGVFDGKPKSEFKIEVANGNVTGYENFDKFGKTGVLTTSTPPVDIWNGGGLYTGFPTGAAETMEIFSSSNLDDIAGTGARTVTIYNLLDDTGARMPDVTVTLDGTNPVSLGAQEYYRGGTRIRVITAGSAQENQGVITLRHTTTTANVFAKMPVGNNQTSIMAYTIALGEYILIDRMDIRMSRSNGSAGSASILIKARPHGGVFNTFADPEITESNPYVFENNGYLKFTERVDLKITVSDVSDNNTIVQAGANGILCTC